MIILLELGRKVRLGQGLSKKDPDLQKKKGVKNREERTNNLNSKLNFSTEDNMEWKPYLDPKHLLI